MLQYAKYVRAESPEEAYALLKKGRMNRILGGGVWLRLQTRRVSTMIDLRDCGLDQIEETEDAFRIGAMVTLHQLEKHEAFNAATNHVFDRAVRDIVGVQMRNLATVGGSLFGRFGFSDVLTALMPLDCSVELVGAGTVPLEEFARMPYERDVLTHLVVRKHLYRASFQALRRSATDFPVLNVCAAAWDNAWRVAVGARPTRARLVAGDDLALPLEFNAEQLTAACDRLATTLTFSGNMRGSQRYRQHLARTMGRRAILEAAGMADPAPAPEPFARPVAATSAGASTPAGTAAPSAAADPHATDAEVTL